jgi:hypothetical protein
VDAARTLRVGDWVVIRNSTKRFLLKGYGTRSINGLLGRVYDTGDRGRLIDVEVLLPVGADLEPSGSRIDFWRDFFATEVEPCQPTEEQLAEWMLIELST